MSDERNALRASYDSVAEDYVAHVAPVQRKPFDCAWLDRFIAHVGHRGDVWDLGCGPGDVTRCLADRGVHVVGVDQSEEMLAQARKLNPDLAFRADDILALSAPNESLAGVTAFYSLIHFAPTLMSTAFAEIHRALKRDGALLIALHAGNDAIHLDEWWGQSVSVDTHFHSAENIEKWLQDAGFSIDEIKTRPPYAEFEYPSERIYALARKA